MTKMFTKGQRVFEIDNWSRKGTFFSKEWIVDSCGAKRITFRAADGSMRKHEMSTAWAAGRIFDAATTDRNAKALELSAKFIIEERARIAKCIASYIDTYGDQPGGANYVRVMAEDENDLRSAVPTHIER